MHPRNKLRLLAGLTINPALEVTPVTEARAVPRRRAELTKKSPATIKAHVDGLTKAIQHLKNAVKALDRIPAHDFMGDIPNAIADIEEMISTDGGEAGLEQLLTVYRTELAQLNESHIDKDDDGEVKTKGSQKGKISKSGKGEGDDEEYTVKMKAKQLVDESSAPMPADGHPTTSQQFKDGDIVLYDDGIYVVVLSDPQADMVGIIPAGLANASADEKNRSVEMVKPDKVRKPTDEELAVMKQSPAQRASIDDDMAAQFSMESVEEMEANLREWTTKKMANGGRKYKKEMNKKQGTKPEKFGKKKEEECEMTESTHNYVGNTVSHKDTESDPINVVGQGDKQWANSLDPKMVKSEIPTQLDNRGEQSMTDYETKVKFPSKLRSAMTSAISEFRANAERQGSGHTAQENAQLYADTADAFEKLLGHLEAGTVQELKNAQVFAQTLMGPMLHKLPAGVWDYITNGGQKKTLKDYMLKV